MGAGRHPNWHQATFIFCRKKSARFRSPGRAGRNRPNSEVFPAAAQMARGGIRALFFSFLQKWGFSLGESVFLWISWPACSLPQQFSVVVIMFRLSFLSRKLCQIQVARLRRPEIVRNPRSAMSAIPYYAVRGSEWLIGTPKGLRLVGLIGA